MLYMTYQGKKSLPLFIESTGFKLGPPKKKAYSIVDFYRFVRGKLVGGSSYWA